MKKFKVLSSKLIVDSPYCPIEQQLVELPDGSTTDWYISRNDPAVIVVPLSSNGEIMLQRTYKHGCGDVVVEFCAGMIDEGEMPLDAAKRELKEETGWICDKMTLVGHCFASPTGSSMEYYFFVAEELFDSGHSELEPAEQIDNFWVKDIEDAKKHLMKNKNTSAACLAAVTYFDWWQENFDNRP